MPPFDDNPFERPSAWPKRPQAPFRIGPLPKAGAVSPRRDAPRPAQRSPVVATPSPTVSGPATGIFAAGPIGGVVGGARARSLEPAPQAAPRPPAELAPTHVAEVEVVAPPRARPAEPDHVAPPPRLGRASGRKLAPLVGAGVLAAAGAAVLAGLLAHRASQPAEPVVTLALPPAAQPAAAPPAAPPVEVARPAPPVPRRAPAAKAAAARSLAPPAPAADPAPEPVPILVAPPPAAPVDPPAPVDPAAPIVTRPPYSE